MKRVDKTHMSQDRHPEETRQLLDQLFTSNPDVVWMVSPDWTELKFVDEDYEDLWGRPVSALAEDPSDFLDGVHPAERERVIDEMVSLSRGNVVDVECRVNEAENYERHVWIEGRPIYDDADEEVAVAGFARDITERKRYEQELARKNERLTEFASLVSHDLRNPLNVAMGRLELAQRDRESEHLAVVERSLERMEALIDDLLTLALDDETIQDTEPVSLAATVDTCWQTVETADATLHNDADHEIVADSSRLQQVFENLFRNAVEHGGREVTVQVGDLDAGFYVADDGPGIPAADRDEVFEPGYSTTTSGTGVGLGIVEQVATAHDWDVEVTESDDGGARFEVSGVELVQ